MSQKQLFTELIKEKRRFYEKPYFLILTGLLFLIAGIISINYSIKEEGISKEALETSKQVSPQMMVKKIQDLENEIKIKQSDIFKLISAYKSKTGEDFSGLNFLDLNEREKENLEKRIKEEKSLTIKSLLGEIIKNSDLISKMQLEIFELEKQCPVPVIVQEGENHFQIAYNYLEKNSNLSKEDIIKMVNKTVLLDNLAPGFKVWNFFDDGIFGTFVTQGWAKISPGKLHRVVRERLIEEKVNALKKYKELDSDIKILKNNNIDLNYQLASLNLKQRDLVYKFSDLKVKHQNLDTKWNSMFYILDHYKNLIKEGVLKRRFLKKTKINTVNNNIFCKSIDLRNSKEIRVNAEQFNSKKIKSLTLFPKHYKKGIDYEISINGPEAVLTILAPEKLKNERVIISVGI